MKKRSAWSGLWVLALLCGCGGGGGASGSFTAAEAAGVWELDGAGAALVFGAQNAAAPARLTLNADGSARLERFPNILIGNSLPLPEEAFASGDGTWSLQADEGRLRLNFRQHERDYFLMLKPEGGALTLPAGTGGGDQRLRFAKAAAGVQTP